MIEKSLSVPGCTRYTLDFSLPELRAGGKIGRVRLSHVKEEGGAFVCAEGMALKHDAGRKLAALLCTSAEPAFYSASSIQFYMIDTKFSAYIRDDVCRLIECFDKNGMQVTCLLAPSHLYRLTDTSYATVTYFGGSCAALHYERLYFGSNRRLYYSEPMVFTALTTNTTYGGGYIDFADAAGNILEIISFKEKLYLFRERGITAVTAFGDPLNFKTAALPYACGKIVPGSAVNCGERIYFFTENGLYAFDGSLCKKAENAGEDEIDLTATLSAVRFQGGYYAAVQKRDGTRVLYSYDGNTERGRYINYAAELIAANDTLYFTQGNIVYEFSDRAMPGDGECALEVSFTLGDHKSGEKFAESVCVAGKGGIALSLVSDQGEQTKVRGDCGKIIRLPRALRGETFELKIMPDDADFEIRSVSVNVRRDGV